jgi:hypothetical protein
MKWVPAPAVDNSRAVQVLLIVLSVTAGCTDVIERRVLCRRLSASPPAAVSARHARPRVGTWFLALPAGLALLAFAMGFAAEPDDGPRR